MSAKPTCPECQTAMTLRKSLFGEFWGCSRYPTCCGRRGKGGNAQPPGRKNQAAREAENRAVTERLARIALLPDSQPCPFDDVPGENDVYTAFGKIGFLEATEAVSR